MSQRAGELVRSNSCPASLASRSSHWQRNTCRVWWLFLLVSTLLWLGTQQSFAQALAAPNFTVSTPQNTPVTINFASFNGSNPAATDVALQSISGGPAHGTAVITSALTVNYTPVPGFVGTDSFVYQLICDCVLTSASGTVTVIVDSTTVDSSIYGLIGALQQTTLATAFAQIDNFDRHLDDLH
ncbi:MAG TPA: Ig-like domain-containing protein, partial [Stellaceae bacterium]